MLFETKSVAGDGDSAATVRRSAPSIDASAPSATAQWRRSASRNRSRHAVSPGRETRSDTARASAVASAATRSVARNSASRHPPAGSTTNWRAPVAARYVRSVFDVGEAPKRTTASGAGQSAVTRSSRKAS
jgi:hypothetical protein